MPVFAFLTRVVVMLALAVCVTMQRPDGVAAQEAPQDLQPLLQAYQDDIANPSRQTIGPVIADLLESGHPGIADFLRKWEEREVYVRPGDGQFFYAEEAGGDLRLIDIDSGEAAGVVGSRAVDQIRPNAGVRRELAAALVPVELTAPDPARRQAALDAILRSSDASQIAPLAGSIDSETEPAIKTRKERLLALLTAQFGATKPERLDAIAALAGDTSIEARGVLNQLTATRDGVAETLPEDANIARVLEVGTDITESQAHDRLVAENRVPPRQTEADLREVLAQHIVDGRVGGVPVHRCNPIQRSRKPRKTRSTPPPARSASTRPPIWCSTGCRWHRSSFWPPSGLPSPSASWVSSTWRMASSS